jgi:hypothetical protein|tara:strand:+ start:15423 stop:15581 length:159 start_codon:yes stop_codon:yes gene_type:complete
MSTGARRLITTTEGERWKHTAARLQGELAHANAALASLGAEVRDRVSITSAA